MNDRSAQLLFRYYENIITPEEKTEFMSHLKSDKEFQAQFIRESMLRTVIHEWAAGQMQPAIVFEGNVEISVMGREYSLPEGITIIGRSDGADITVESAKLSRSHARFIIENGTVSVEDLDSKNGTFVNHEQIHEKTRLNLGDSVSFANVGCDIDFPEIAGFDEPDPVEPDTTEEAPSEKIPEPVKPVQREKAEPVRKISSLKEAAERSAKRKEHSVFKIYAAAAAVILGAVLLFNMIPSDNNTIDTDEPNTPASAKETITEKKRKEISQRISGIIRNVGEEQMSVSEAQTVLEELKSDYGEDFILGPSINAAFSEIEAQAILAKKKREEAEKEALAQAEKEKEEEKKKAEQEAEKEAVAQVDPEPEPEPEPIVKKPEPEKKTPAAAVWDKERIAKEIKQSEALTAKRNYEEASQLYAQILANTSDPAVRTSIGEKSRMNTLYNAAKTSILEFSKADNPIFIKGLGRVTKLTSEFIKVISDGTELSFQWDKINEDEFRTLAMKALPPSPSDDLLIAHVWMSLQKKDYTAAKHFMSKASGLSRVIQAEYPGVHALIEQTKAEIAKRKKEEEEKKAKKCPRAHQKKQIYDNGRSVTKGLIEPPRVVAARKPADTSKPTAVIGDGTPESITMDKIQSALKPGAVITFNTGGKPVTIEITKQLYMPATEKPAMTIIDGGGLVTFDGKEKNRFMLKGWKNELTIQRTNFINCRAEKEGGAIKVENWDGKLFIVDCTFKNCKTTKPGPDIGGGAIRTTGQKEWMVSGCTFIDCAGSNGGAICDIGSPIIVVNSTFQNCRAFGYGGGADRGPTGQGGIGGAIYNDGVDQAGGETLFYIAGSMFKNNSAGDHAGAIFGYTRPEFKNTNKSIYLACIFEGNSVDQPKARGLGFAGAIYTQYSELFVYHCSFYKNTCPKLGPYLFIATKKPIHIKYCDIWGNRGQGGLPQHAKQLNVKTSKEKVPPSVNYLGRMPGNPMDGK